MNDPITVERLQGERIVAVLDDLARLRLTVFREFPYLYEGSLAYERRYLKTYVDSPDSLVVAARDGGRIVGCSTGLPLSDETPEFRRPFEERGIDPDRVFYFAESVLLPEYRGRGVGARLFAEREHHARALGRFDYACFAVVERPPDHPRRPAGYTPLDAFWQRRGYVKQPDLRTTFAWQDLDEAAESAKPMVFWLKRLNGAPA